MNRAKTTLESLIMVKRDTKALVTPDCYGRNLGQDVTTTGVEADLIISPGFDFTLQDSSGSCLLMWLGTWKSKTSVGSY